MFDLGAFKLQNERKNIDTSIFVLWSVNVMDLTRECVCILTVLKYSIILFNLKGKKCYFVCC